MTDRTWSSFVVAVLAISLILTSLTCSKKDSEANWKAVVETVDGVRTVKNPATSKYGEFAFELAEDLAIGDEANEAYLFSRGAMLSIDDTGAF
jgi:hypothetical protein